MGAPGGGAPSENVDGATWRESADELRGDFDLLMVGCAGEIE